MRQQTSDSTVTSPKLIDPFGRRIEYVRLSVTDKCNLRCFYCIPEHHKDFEHPEHWLNFDEIERVIAAFAELGVARVRITGGEPLVRKNISQLVTRLGNINGIDDLSLSTNAVLLDRHAQQLKQAGISRINVSLDSLRADRFKQITGGTLQPVLDGLSAARCAGFEPVKINMVAMKGINDDEFEDMVDYCIDNGFTLRFIETMPMGDTGRRAGDHYVDLQTVRRKLAQRFDLVDGVMPGGGPARYWQVAETQTSIGFITPISQHFCETCNRVRLAVDGRLHMCLGQDHSYDLRAVLRQGVSDQELQAHILQAIELKPERHEFKERPEQVVRFMSMTGG